VHQLMPWKPAMDAASTSAWRWRWFQAVGTVRTMSLISPPSFFSTAMPLACCRMFAITSSGG